MKIDRERFLAGALMAGALSLAGCGGGQAESQQAAITPTCEPAAGGAATEQQPATQPPPEQQPAQQPAEQPAEQPGPTME